ncbi:MAG: hypothetical protein WEB93_00075 [Sphingomonadales bacterium]
MWLVSGTTGKVVWSVGAVVILCVLVVLGYRVWTLDRRFATVEDQAFSVVATMGQYQRFVEKLYFAGEAVNWPLAKWYAWKLNATLLVMKEGQIGHYRAVTAYDVAELTGLMLEPVVMDLYPIIEAEDLNAFRMQYRTLIDTCNACHQATEHEQVVITIPDRPSFSNQSFAPPADVWGTGPQ